MSSFFSMCILGTEWRSCLQDKPFIDLATPQHWVYTSEWWESYTAETTSVCHTEPEPLPHTSIHLCLDCTQGGGAGSSFPQKTSHSSRKSWQHMIQEKDRDVEKNMSFFYLTVFRLFKNSVFLTKSTIPKLKRNKTNLHAWRVPFFDPKVYYSLKYTMFRFSWILSHSEKCTLHKNQYTPHTDERHTHTHTIDQMLLRGKDG